MLRAQVWAGLRSLRTALEFGDTKFEQRSKQGVEMEFEQVKDGATLDVAVPGVGKAGIRVEGSVSGLFDASDEELYRRLQAEQILEQIVSCLLYTSDAADEEDSVDLGGRRIIKTKKKQ
eukprot:TRINITY_DN28622_c0_g1_i3.p1 TRINITY_DN28622_c0_g1~~TRINITY_DN28622_c0_g1_i3.p1  ORF type:complete len:119 (-),score=37.79 TRINITY_DN28622_c0_g1_i3:37-393(-)